MESLGAVLGVELGSLVNPKSDAERKEVYRMMLHHPHFRRKGTPEPGSDREVLLIERAPGLMRLVFEGRLSVLTRDEQDFQRQRARMAESPVSEGVTLETRIDCLRELARIARDAEFGDAKF